MPGSLADNLRSSMVAKYVILTAAIGTLLVIPALCLADLIEHPCSCKGGSDSCSHEEDCSGDPCAKVVSVNHPVRSERPEPVCPDALPTVLTSDWLVVHSCQVLEPPRPLLSLPHYETPLPLLI